MNLMLKRDSEIISSKQGYVHFQMVSCVES